MLAAPRRAFSRADETLNVIRIEVYGSVEKRASIFGNRTAFDLIS